MKSTFLTMFASVKWWNCIEAQLRNHLWENTLALFVKTEVVIREIWTELITCIKVEMEMYKETRSVHTKINSNSNKNMHEHIWDCITWKIGFWNHIWQRKFFPLHVQSVYCSVNRANEWNMEINIGKTRNVERKEMSICECCIRHTVRCVWVWLHTMQFKGEANVLHRVEHVWLYIMSTFQNQLNQFSIERFLYQQTTHTFSFTRSNYTENMLLQSWRTRAGARIRCIYCWL